MQKLNLYLNKKIVYNPKMSEVEQVAEAKKLAIACRKNAIENDLTYNFALGL
jgi:hypothetical protein